jgi:hypothetical protein
MQSFAQSLFNRQNNRPMQQQANAGATVQNAQAPYRACFPMTPSDFYKKFGAPVSARQHTRLTDNNGQPLIGFRFSKPIVAGLEPEVFASKALMDAGFTYDNFAEALLNGDDTLQIVAHEGSNDIYVSPCKSVAVNTSIAMAAISKFKANKETSQEEVF